MELEAVYENGKLEFSAPVHFKKDRVRMVVIVPDDAIEPMSVSHDLPREVIDLADQMHDQLDSIRNAPLPRDDQLPPVSEKEIERLEAFSLREDR